MYNVPYFKDDTNLYTNEINLIGLSIGWIFDNSRYRAVSMLFRVDWFNLKNATWHNCAVETGRNMFWGLFSQCWKLPKFIEQFLVKL